MQAFLGVFLAVLSFSKNNSLTAYKFIKIRAIINVQMLLIGAKMKIIRLRNTSRAFPSLTEIVRRSSDNRIILKHKFENQVVR